MRVVVVQVVVVLVVVEGVVVVDVVERRFVGRLVQTHGDESVGVPLQLGGGDHRRGVTSLGRVTTERFESFEAAHEVFLDLLDDDRELLGGVIAGRVDPGPDAQDPQAAKVPEQPPERQLQPDQASIEAAQQAGRRPEFVRRRRDQRPRIDV